MQLIVIISIKGKKLNKLFELRCDGGYPFLVEKFASEKELVREECHPYQGQNGVCSDSCDLSEEEKLYKVSDYRFIGG